MKRKSLRFSLDQLERIHVAYDTFEWICLGSFLEENINGLAVLSLRSSFHEVFDITDHTDDDAKDLKHAQANTLHAGLILLSTDFF